MAKVYGIANGSNGYNNGDVFLATSWKDCTPVGPEFAQDVDGVWVEVHSVFVVDNDEVLSGGYDFLDLIPREV